MIAQVPRRLVVHHSAGLQGFDAIQREHLKKYDEIAYHLVLERDGIRRWGRPLGVQPAANSGANRDTLAVCVVGDNTDIELPDFGFDPRFGPKAWTREQCAELRAVVIALRLLYPSIEDVVGHSQHATEHGKATECPGISAEELRRLVGI